VKTRITKEQWLRWYEDMLFYRKFEEKCAQLYGQRKIRGFLHLYIGEEAVAVGIASALKPGDKMISAYREHVQAMVMGTDPNAVMAELYGKSTGSSKGKGGSMHIFDKVHNFYGGHGIVGAQIPIGAGIAMAEKYRKTGNICVTFFGDGAAFQGALHETFNMSAKWGLPVLFVLENNRYAMGTAVDRISAVSELAHLGATYGIQSKSINGMDVGEVYKAAREAVEYVRELSKPYFLEVKTYRYRGHSMSDPAKYRTREEVESYKRQDPIERLRTVLIKKKYVTEESLKVIQQRVQQRVEAAVRYAEESPFPPPEELYTDVYRQSDYPFLD